LEALREQLRSSRLSLRQLYLVLAAKEQVMGDSVSDMSVLLRCNISAKLKNGLSIHAMSYRGLLCLLDFTSTTPILVVVYIFFQVPSHLPLVLSPPAVAVLLHSSSNTATFVVPTDIVSPCTFPVSSMGIAEPRTFKGDQGSIESELTFTDP
jgi:hypothetical protein